MSSTSTTEQITYYVETQDGKYRLNVPKDWTISTDITRNGVIVASFIDDKGSERQVFTGVQNIRDSATQIQTLEEVDETVGDETVVRRVWEELPTDQAQTAYAMERIQGRAIIRRRRASQTGGTNDANARLRFNPADEVFDEGF